ncbi:MAG: hypothetical protein EXR91_02895 [Gemmatimonadetes bacterium]|nr:hypothetical protein [Gemmatimonadota bacterium]
MRRAAALAVALLCVLPLHRLLTPERNGPAGADALARADPLWGLTFWGSILVALVGLIGGVLTHRRLVGTAGSAETAAVPTGAEVPGSAAGPGRASALAVALVRALSQPTPRTFALGVAGLAAVLAGAVALGLQQRLLTGVDEMAALIHARYLAGGMLAGPMLPSSEAWLIPNMLVTQAGWVSQYPPGHLLAWAAFVLVGLRWAAGPLLFALMVGLVAASFDRLLPPERRTHGRVAAVFLAVSPFMLPLAAGSPSHVTAGAAGALALYAALRAADGRVSWALVAGAAVGGMVLARPWTGLVLGPTLTLGVWLERGGIALVRRTVVPWIVGGIPFALLLFAFNSALFGSPLTLGYAALNGPAHGLGLHADPWSFPYGLREAVAYSASDVTQFGAMLLETPVSLVLVAAAYLALASRLASGVSVVAAWALLPVFAQAIYWLHAPRMHFEATPAWILLAVLAVADAHERAGPALRAGVRWGVATTLLVAAVALVPTRMRSHAWPAETLTRITIPEGAADGALVFVHAAWDERLAAMLQASGMRADSIQAIVRRNDTCRLHEYALARLAGVPAASLPAIDGEQTPTPPDGLAALQTPRGSVVWRGEGTPWPEACVRELMADRFGSVALAPLLWQGDLPGLEGGAPMFVRDLGPARNEIVLASFPGRMPQVLAYPAMTGGPPLLAPYDEAMATLWGRP